MADEKKEQTGGSGTESGKKGGISTMLLAITLVNTLLVLGLAAYVIMGKSSTPVADAPAEEATGDGGDPAAVVDAVPQVVDFEPFLVNLNDSGVARYLRATLKVEVTTPEDIEKVKARTAKVRDIILTYLSSLNLAQTQGTVAKEIIRKQVIKRIKQELPDMAVKDVYFTEFVTQ